ncbi:MAG: sulfatase, partial [Phycisphaerae bacterium]
GWESPHTEADMRVRCRGLDYPLQPLTIRQNAPRHNIVWLVCESLRADAIDPEIMPKTHAFASGEALWFRRCYSAGDGTRMGMFGLFYGLHGSYWFPALRANRGPVLIDVLRRAGYQFDCRTSQSFTYPEFDRTVFVDVPSASLHAISGGAPGWQRDRQNVGQMLR